ncbi:MAG: M20 family peptidase [Steroidobacteraceae bacterium]
MTRKILWGALALLVVVVLIRTFAYRTGIAQAPVAMAAPVPIDVNQAAVHLGQAIRFQTISHQDPEEDDPKAWDDQRAWLQATYPKFHALAQREVVGGGALIYTWKGTAPALQPVVLMAHQDVVPISPGTEGQWKAPPFSGALLDGAVWGRGSIDDKGSLIAIMEACEALVSKGFTPKRTVIIVSGEHEETSGGSIDQVAALLAKREVHALFVLDEGLSIIDDNPITGKSSALIGVAEKGYATLKVTAKGTGGHSSTPPKSTAVVTLAKAVVAIADKPFPLKIDGTTQVMLKTLAPQMPLMTRIAVANTWLFGSLVKRRFAASPVGAAQLHTTIAPTMLQGSPKENVLPQEAIGRINYRIYPGETVDEVMARAARAVGDLPVKLEWEEGARNPSAVASTSSDAYRVIAALVQDMEQVPSAPALMIAATDSYRMSPIATDIYKFEFTRGSVADVEMIHGTNEHLSLANLKRLTEFFARLIATTSAR